MMKYIMRALFMLFWVIVIYAFLLLPYLEPWFFKDRKYLCVYTWPDRIDEALLKDFEQKTGITIYVNHYESNEELLTKLENMPFVDCDVIIPSGYIIESMANAGLIKKIDTSKCHFLDAIYPEFIAMGDPVRAEYALPLYWDILGLGYNNQRLSISEPSWKMIFDCDVFNIKKIGMIDDSRQSIVLTALYLGFDLDHLNSDHLKEMRSLLDKQKKWVGSYSDSQQGYFLASKTFDIVVSEREHVCRQMQQYDFISFALPKEGSLLTADNIVISASSKKDEMIYELINYLFSYDICKKHCEKFCLLPTRKDVRESLDDQYTGGKDLVPGSEQFKTLKVFKNILTSKQINDFWIKLKAN